MKVETASGDVGPLPNGKILRVFSLGFDRVAADLFWIRTVYYMGDEHSTAAGYPAAERLAELVTDIDPTFQTVYIVMGSGLEGLVGDPAAGRRLLEKGIRNLSYWKLNFLLGFNYFFHEQDYANAAEQMRLAAEQPGSPPYLPLLVTRLYAAAGEPQTAMLLVRARLENSRDVQEREALQERYRDLWIHRDLALIDAAIAQLKAKTGRTPVKVTELLSAGLLAAEPVDPRGGKYEIRDGHAACLVPHEKLKIKLGGLKPSPKKPPVTEERKP